MTDSNIGGEASILEERRRKLEELRADNKAYINNFFPTKHALELHALHGHLSKEDLETAQIHNLALAGRIVLKRVMGNASFITIRDGSGDIQIYISKNNIDVDLYKNFKTWDLGDIIGTTGNLFKTKTEELTLEAHSIVLITKALRPMPEKHKGLADIETRYRQRYIDLMSNPDSKEIFVKRSNIVASVRQTMIEDGFLEVETPMMHSIPGGAVAKPFVTHHNALDRELFLRIAPELHLKRLLVGGFEKVFEINRSFRNEGLSTRHNPEFTMLEFYAAFATFGGTISFTTNLIQSASKAIGNGDRIEWDGDQIDLSSFTTKTLSELVLAENTALGRQDLSNLEKLRAHAASIKLSFKDSWGPGKLLLEIFEKTVESKLIQPTFVIEYPVEVSPLSRRNNEDPSIADRFELFVGGKEIANGFCELNDPDDQAERFKEQVQAKADGDDEAMGYDEDYVAALEHGMPPAVGVGVGIDRLVMMLTNQSSIRDVILFPQLKS
ncbi:MAG: lysine--tRNA ligase [SAR86 cluster bacterium BACL1 MAG-121105-bin34]|jgi:lysyl-tRNA synthetase, class II|uniref:Lysine--tRNA ligase n=2 Tax=SAR86 cluster TaxID=62672 RepID=A0A0R2U759_9GAMM|nr:MAG: lysine--tRNA ligase [SAR86 cluster bacterium BACL1 MAG-120920-bin57]KRO95385.1 MAG: lysine--tRNA ligase [SAR86 cluster bacterium BACL1 MAG-120820-bin45]KRO97354.1 MAG: lysine--tRNA ligase [SAR86 cluster bacterium BACL1 MAG-120828-bin5]KRO99870.1 MAG: lysine--tRNA ligase [SAR86 cluster bacterium BACL1 MAG-120813-bin36]KRP01858.1 MAG: lysine--tRNA ligase [SAR86 cluster bacterium BACL1 MAG-120619-bin26]KRP02616.1 MAG: lysine--tRNA ligase [SAR86 cluster bacterium BACL1 MAG-120924-bin88]KR